LEQAWIQADLDECIGDFALTDAAMRLSHLISLLGQFKRGGKATQDDQSKAISMLYRHVSHSAGVIRLTKNQSNDG
jgi:hypothetical protein